MYTKILIVDDTCEWQGVKYIHDAKVKILVVFFTAFLIKVKTLSHLPGFVVTSQHEDVILVLDFHCHQQDDDFHSEGSSIDIIAQKQEGMLGIVIDVWAKTEYFHEVSELAVDVTNDGDGLGLDEYVRFVFDDVVEADDNVFDELEGDGFFLVKTFLEVGDVDLSVGSLEMLDIYWLLFLHGA
jgi:hypothetical protein